MSSEERRSTIHILAALAAIGAFLLSPAALALHTLPAPETSFASQEPLADSLPGNDLSSDEVLGENGGDAAAAEPVPTQKPKPQAERQAEPVSAPEPAPLPTQAEAVRFLVQASFGPTEADVADVTAGGYERWLEEQMALAARPIVPRLMEHHKEFQNDALNAAFWEYAIEGEDQLRQRAAFALSQIIVISSDHFDFRDKIYTFAVYMDLLQEQAFGNYLDIVREVSLLPAMGSYLTHLGSQKADPAEGFEPDENYAREVMQLFTIGLEELRPDGTSTGAPTYDSDDVKGLAAVFTGFSWAGKDFERARERDENRLLPMQGYPDFHESGPKTFLGTTVDLGAKPEESVQAALDHLLAHPNVGPFISKQLIQRMVTSNPSPAYVRRVVSAFEAGTYQGPGGQTFGAGRRGDLAATFAAILLDEEARSAEAAARPGFGRVRDPILRFAHFARTFKDDRDAERAGPFAAVGPMNWADNLDFLGQKAYAPPSVFGFTRPGYVPAGTRSAKNGLVAPELVLATGASLPGYISTMTFAIDDGFKATRFFRPDYSSIALVADDAKALVDRLDTLLTYGTLQEDTRARILSVLAEVPIRRDQREGDRLRRVKLALLMITTSTEYAVQR